MPLTKIYCKGPNHFVRHNNDLDLSSNQTNWLNTGAGSSLGSTPALDKGWSYVGLSSVMPENILSLYPQPQLPTFRDHSTLIKRPTDTFSQKHTAMAKYPWMSSSSMAFTGRAETYTANSIVKRKDLCFRISVYKPVEQPYDNLESSIFFQVHGGSSSPPIAFSEYNQGELDIRIFYGSGTQNTTRIFLGEMTKGVWHNFTLFITFSQSITEGKFLLFKENKIARTRARSGVLGAYTFTKGLVPKVTGTSASEFTLNTDVLGDLPLQINEAGINTNLVYFKGRTLSSVATISSIYPKWGIYKSSWGKYYNTPAATSTNISNGMDIEDAILKNPNDPSEPFYIPIANREYTLHTSNAFGYVGAGETYEDLFVALNDGQAIDAGDRALISSIPDLSWFTLNEVAPPVTEYTLTITETTGGTVSAGGGSFVPGTSITRTALANPGFFFLDWINTATGTIVSVLPTFSFNMPSGNLNLRARFQQLSVPPEPGISNRFFAKKPSIIV